MIDNKKIKVAVFGVGHLGQHHARVYSQLPEAELVAVVDNDFSAAEKFGKKFGCAALADYREILGKVDATSLVVTTPLHFSIGKDLLSAGLHVLIEKPLASSLEEAEELISLAQQKNSILQVGHIERFNSGLVETQKYISRPRFIEANRLGPYDPRTSHIGVILDLMIHDLDIVLQLVNSKIETIEADAAAVFSGYEDIAKVRLRFANGCIADLSASRISLEKFRKIRIFQPESYISLDYIRQELKIYHKKESVEQVKSLTDIEVIRPKLKSQEPLQEELKHFLECVRTGKTPLVTGEHGRDALELALEILRKTKIQTVK